MNPFLMMLAEINGVDLRIEESVRVINGKKTDYVPGDIVYWRGTDPCIARIKKAHETIPNSFSLGGDREICHVDLLQPASAEQAAMLGDADVLLLDEPTLPFYDHMKEGIEKGYYKTPYPEGYNPDKEVAKKVMESIEEGRMRTFNGMLEHKDVKVDYAPGDIVTWIGEGPAIGRIVGNYQGFPTVYTFVKEKGPYSTLHVNNLRPATKEEIAFLGDNPTFHVLTEEECEMFGLEYLVDTEN